MRWWLLALTACGRIDFSAERAIDAPAVVVDDGISDPCGTTLLARDAFNDGSPAPLFMSHADTGLAITESASGLTVTFAASVGGGSYAYYRTVASYTTEGLCATVEVANVPDEQQTNAAAYVKLRNASMDEVELFEHGGSLDLRVHDTSGVHIVDTLPYTAALRFWRLRQQAGTTYWDTSTDGVTFTQQFARAGFPVASCQLELGAGAAATVSTAGTATFPGAKLTGP